MKKLFSFVSGAILGGLFGATLAILLAPAEGKQLQERMKNSFIEIKDEVNQAAASKREELTKQLETLRKG